MLGATVLNVFGVEGAVDEDIEDDRCNCGVTFALRSLTFSEILFPTMALERLDDPDNPLAKFGVKGEGNEGVAESGVLEDDEDDPPVKTEDGPVLIGEIVEMGDVRGGTQLLFTEVNGDVCPRYGTGDTTEEHDPVLVVAKTGNFQLAEDVVSEIVCKAAGFVSYFSLKFTNLSQSSSKMLFLARTVLPMEEVFAN